MSKKFYSFLEDDEDINEAKNYVSEKDIKAIQKKAKKDTKRPVKKVRRDEP